MPWKKLFAKLGAFLLRTAEEEGKKALIVEAEKHGLALVDPSKNASDVA